MTVKELITRLLDEPMNAEVRIKDPTTHHLPDGELSYGYLFEIIDIEPWSRNLVCIDFEDWRNIR